MLRDSSPTLPEMMNYNKIFSITWIWSLIVLSLAYTGQRTTTQTCAELMKDSYHCRNSYFPPDKALATRLFQECRSARPPKQHSMDNRRWFCTCEHWKGCRTRINVEVSMISITVFLTNIFHTCSGSSMTGPYRSRDTKRP